jgi:hypothetical protein
VTTNAVGYRIKWLLGVSVTGATYGSGQYGTGIYGTRASDDLGSQAYRIVPIIPTGGASSMNDPELTIVRGDQLPTVTVQIIGDDDRGLNLTGTQVYFHWRALETDRADASSGGCTIIDGPNGVVNFDWQAGDAGLAGEYLAEFEVVYPSGRRLTVPTIGKLRLHVPDDIADN